MTTTTVEWHTIKAHKLASDTLQAMGLQAQLVAQAWERIDPELALRTTTSLARQTTQLFNMFFGQESTITKDGDLNLYVQTASGFVFGVIFHPVHYRVDAPEEADYRLTYGSAAPREGRYCVQEVPVADPVRRCGQPYREGQPTCKGHDPFPMAVPMPGEWSFHS
jgi:hypothetical protein